MSASSPQRQSSGFRFTRYVSFARWALAVALIGVVASWAQTGSETAREGAESLGAGVLLAAPALQRGTPPIGPGPGGSPTPKATAGPPGPTAAPLPTMELVGLLGSFGQFNTVAAQGSRAYIGKGRVVEVLDGSDPMSLSLLGSGPVLPAIVRDIAIVGDTLYVALGAAGVAVMERSDTPALLSILDTPGEAQHIALDADATRARAYVSDGLGGVRILDVSSPLEPREIGVYDTWRSSRSSAAEGDLLVVAESDNFEVGLSTVDISDPTRPRELAFRDTLGGAGGVGLRGPRAILASGASLRTFDLSDPGRPDQLGMFPPRPDGVGVRSEPAPAVDWRGDVAYAAQWSRGLRVWNVADLSKPLIAMTIDTEGTAADLSVADGMLWLADGAAGVRLFDLSDPARPAPRGSYGLAVGSPISVAIADGHLVVGDEESGVTVVDVGDPSAPFPVGSTAVGSLPLDIDLSSNHALVASSIASGRCPDSVPGPCGLQVLDITDPADPRWIGNGASDFMGRAVTSDGRFAYLATAQGRHRVARDWVLDAPALRVIDIDKPLRPAERGFTEGLQDPWDVVLDVERSLVFVADGPGGMRVVDVSNPRSPRAQGVMPVADGRIAYAVLADVDPGQVWLGGNGFLSLVDVRDPWRPKLVKTTAVAADVRALARDGATLLAGAAGGAQSRGVWAFTPDENGGLEPMARWPDMAVDDLSAKGNLYVAVSSEGAVALLRLGTPVNSGASPTPPAATSTSPSPSPGTPRPTLPVATSTTTAPGPSATATPSGPPNPDPGTRLWLPRAIR